MSDKSTLLFDEPTANLDDENGRIFWRELLKLNRTIIVVSHDTPEEIRQEFDEILDFMSYVEKKLG